LSRTYDYDALFQSPESQAILARNLKDPWPELRSADPGPFPVDALPQLGRRMAVQAAETLQVSPAMSGCFLLGALSAAAVGRARVDMGSGYREPVQLYIAVGADPSERKSPCLKMMTQPLHAYQQEENERRAPEMRQQRLIRETREIALRKAQQKGDEQEVARLGEELAGMRETRPYHLILTDATAEALGQAMSKNEGRMAVISGEGALLSVLAGCYAQGPANLDAVLQGYSGEAVSVARIGRPPVQIKEAALSICLAVQTEVLDSFLQNQQLRQRGTVARFLVAEPESMIGRRQVIGPAMAPQLQAEYDKRLKDILALPAPIPLKPDEDARAAWEDWASEVERRSLPGGDLRGLAGGWEGKLAGNTLRIAGLLTLLEFETLTIREHLMRGAIRIARWFAASMIALTAAASELSPEADEMLRYLARRGESKVSMASVRAGLKNRKRFARAEQVERVVDEIVFSGLAQFVVDGPSKEPGRPYKPSLILHPDILGAQRL
jgi:replicative DNA helicase